ncbi:hypothetical protein B0H14DRAFT_1182538 [Mycena olivaceomarginata]|nr:hypothetical protein B0H14DRAFT_1182538 [Mycena olivaceomarginata]
MRSRTANGRGTHRRRRVNTRTLHLCTIRQLNTLEASQPLCKSTGRRGRSHALSSVVPSFFAFLPHRRLSFPGPISPPVYGSYASAAATRRRNYPNPPSPQFRSAQCRVSHTLPINTESTSYPVSLHNYRAPASGTLPPSTAVPICTSPLAPGLALHLARHARAFHAGPPRTARPIRRLRSTPCSWRRTTSPFHPTRLAPPPRAHQIGSTLAMA